MVATLTAVASIISRVKGGIPNFILVIGGHLHLYFGYVELLDSWQPPVQYARLDRNDKT